MTNLFATQSRQQTGRCQHIDLPINDFTLLAAIGAILRQFSRITPWSRGDARGGRFAASSRAAGEHTCFKQS
jgi:hypothetical protein